MKQPNRTVEVEVKVKPSGLNSVRGGLTVFKNVQTKSQPVKNFIGIDRHSQVSRQHTAEKYKQKLQYK